MPTLKGAQARDSSVETGTAERLLAYLEKFEYASRQHVVVALL